MVHRGSAPVDDDDERQQKTTEGIKPPNFGKVANNGKQDGASVENDIGHGVVGPAGWRNQRVSYESSPCSVIGADQEAAT